MKLRGEDDIKWADCLEDFKPLVYYKCTTPLMFYTLFNRKTTLSKDNLVPIDGLHYAIYAKAENRYYYKQFRGWDFETWYYSRPSLTFSGDDPAMESLKNKIWDGNVWMLLTSIQVESMQKMLQRVADARLSEKGKKLPYKDFLKILEKELLIEDYGQFYKGAVGYRTTVHVWETEINEIWKSVFNKK